MCSHDYRTEADNDPSAAPNKGGESVTWTHLSKEQLRTGRQTCFMFWTSVTCGTWKCNCCVVRKRIWNLQGLNILRTLTFYFLSRLEPKKSPLPRFHASRQCPIIMFPTIQKCSWWRKITRKHLTNQKYCMFDISGCWINSQHVIVKEVRSRKWPTIFYISNRLWCLVSSYLWGLQPWCLPGLTSHLRLFIKQTAFNHVSFR